MKRLLLTGATGFIGKQLLQIVDRSIFEVHIISRKKLNNIENIIAHQCDILDNIATVKTMGKIKPTHLIHLAWDVTPGQFWNSPENYKWMLASLNLFKAFKENDGIRAIFAGTCAEYDWSFPILSENTTPIAPQSLYGKAKAELWQAIKEANYNSTISLAWGKVFFVYGPHEAPGRLISDTIASLIHNKRVYFSQRLKRRDFLHVSDVASAFYSLLNSNVTDAINIASGNLVSIQSIVSTIANILNKQNLLTFYEQDNANEEPTDLGANVNRLNNELIFKPKYTLLSGLEDTIKWTIANQHQ